MKQNASLSLQNCSKSFKNVDSEFLILNNINFTFLQSNSYAIIGESGSGKSTLLNIISKLEHPSSGVVLFNNKSLAKFTVKESLDFYQNKISILTQKPLFIKELNVLENCILKKILKNSASIKDINYGLELLKLLNLSEYAKLSPYVLSGGQQQKLSFIRAIFEPPTFLLLDEPTGNLDNKASEELLNLLFLFQKKYLFGIIFITHSEEIAQKMDYTYILKNKTLIKK